MNGLSKQKQKYIQSLHIKKYRQQFGCFLVEGQKSLEELAKSDFEVKEVFLTERGSELRIANAEINFCSEKDIEKVSSFRSNNYGVAVVACKPNEKPNIRKEWVLALDEIRDPGNLGTIIRIADWYGIEKIICSENTVEFYNPKVISSTMGSFGRVNCYYTNLSKYLAELNLPVYGAYLDGESIHQLDFPEAGVLLMGSESHGISNDLAGSVSNKITIPAFGLAESLNAGVATAVILDNIRRT